ncbi:hypothetical protein PGT21_009265 [Puccinia graminis f. sp. tritici]|uniref:CxC1-like cysteine cluster associated with KDZ transposases domain-containing protein n=1 Tax=Puccinia graminis f. sp. tritici TaxID=56615 RepID=A0A5B0LQB1_PUCGR|nr:hypothetical protein PGT21_009265 [Puccinia graminis f. sp. tritici]
MRGFRGEGGKKPPKIKRPKTNKGAIFLNETNRSSQQFLQANNQLPSGQSVTPTQQTNLDHDNPPDLSTNIDMQQTNPEEEPEPIDPQVQRLAEYLQSQNYRRRKELEEKNWEEVYESMFSSFFQCSTKTSTWGDLKKWDHDWKSHSRKQSQVDFCQCQHDQVRLIQMGYIGGSPKYPKTAFSIRLLRLHHIMWKHSAVPISPFSRAVDEFLDAHNPLILVPSNKNESDYAFTPRQWRRTLSSAVDAFREMLRREELLSESLLSMNPIDKMADICPPCYGPQVPGTRADEPNYIVCMDGNFQHRRHEAASVEVPGMLKTPSLFIKPDEVAQMELSMNPALHNAIEGDVRHQFPEERELNLLKFGTSVFHAYVHEWSCQLRYNPRLNQGWGMSDGEGLERIWSFLSPLISPLRYSTKNHRLVALNIRMNHHNDMGKINTDRGKHVEQVMKDSQDVLRALEEQSGLQWNHFKIQWERQREIQLSTIETATEKETREQVEELVLLEDKLRETHQEMIELRNTRRRNRTDAQNRHLQQLPDTLVMLEGEIESILDELGTDYFQNLQGGSEAEIKALIKIKISKSKLYEAKVGVIEMQKRWDQPRSGTRVQHRFKKQMNSKMNMFKKKWISYNNRATSFNSDFSPEVPLETPSFDDVKAFGIDNFFWSTSQLDHPSEPWAVDVNTQKGIQAYLTVTHCQDELRRIAREARQTVTWAIEKSIKMDQLLQSLQAGQEYLLRIQLSQSSRAVSLHQYCQKALPSLALMELSHLETLEME